MAFVIKQFNAALDGFTSEVMLVGREVDFGSATAGLVAAGLLQYGPIDAPAAVVPKPVIEVIEPVVEPIVVETPEVVVEPVVEPDLEVVDPVVEPTPAPARTPKHNRRNR